MSAVLAALARLNEPTYPLPAEPNAFDLVSTHAMIALAVERDIHFCRLTQCSTCPRVFRWTGDGRIKRCRRCRGAGH